VIALALAAMCLMVGVAHAAQPLGGLTQLPGTAGCFTFNGASEDGAGTCSQARGLADGESAAVSPDGANVYVGSYPNSGASLGAGFAVFSRNQSTGALTQLPGTAGCLTSDGSSSAGAGTCTKARGMTSNAGDGHDIAFTSDGRWAYIVAQNSSPHGAVMIFQRDPSTGALTQLAGTAGCITSDGSDQDGAGQCQIDPTLTQQPDGISISSDDRFLYVIGYETAVHVFARNTTTGELAEVQCLSQAPAPSGCSTGRVLGDSEYLALSPDGLHAYGGQYSEGMSIFDRDPSTGLLTQKTGTAGCITDNGDDNTGASTCASGREVAGAYPILIAPNGATLYNVAAHDGGLSVFHINGDGTLTQLPGTEGCVTDDGKDNTGASTCATAREVGSVYGGVVSPDGASLYVSDNDDAGSGGVAIFALDQTTGVATQMPGLAGCISGDGSSDGTAAECTNGRALSSGYGMTISPDGHSVYQATEDTSNAGLAIYARETGPVCQTTHAATAINDAVSVTLNCADADGDAVTRAITSGPSHGRLSAINNATGTVTYTPAHGFKGADAFTFNATDGVNASAAVAASITVSPASLSKLRVSPSKVSVAGRKVKSRCVKPTKKNNGNKHCRRAIKIRVSYTLGAAATVKFTVQRVTTGRKVNRKCVKQTQKNKKHTKCTRLVSVRGSMSRKTGAGGRAFTFSGKIGGKNLPPGTYKLTATPTSGTPKKATFTITG
jgi:hypothetical protein